MVHWSVFHQSVTIHFDMVEYFTPILYMLQYATIQFDMVQDSPFWCVKTVMVNICGSVSFGALPIVWSKCSLETFIVKMN